MAAGFKSFSSEDGGPDDGSGGFKSSSSEDGPDDGSGGFKKSSSKSHLKSMVWNDLKW